MATVQHPAFERITQVVSDDAVDEWTGSGWVVVDSVEAPDETPDYLKSPDGVVHTPEPEDGTETDVELRDV